MLFPVEKRRFEKMRGEKSMMELGWAASGYFLTPIVVFTVLFTVVIIDGRVKRRAVSTCAAAIVLAAAIGFTLNFSATGSTAMFYMTTAFVMTAVVFILNFVKLNALDYSVMFACFACVIRFVGVNTFHFGIALPFLYVFTVILAVYKMRLKRIAGQLFNLWFAAVFTMLECYTFTILFVRYVLPLGQSSGSNFEKLLVWGLVTAIAVALNVALVYVIKRLFGKHFLEINDMGTAFPKIERYFIYNSAAILLAGMLFYFIYGLTFDFANVPAAAFNLFIAFALAIQLSFLILIFRITWLKDNLKRKTIESQSLADYSSDLEKNINDIKGIKHDIKNIFFTMGGFVERSGNEEMQEFFREKINPLFSEEIAKSDLFGKLSLIANEHFKAFLFYKISQAVERDVAVDLNISPEFSASDIAFEFVDLVRILGILLDNAIEECMLLPQSNITIKLAQNDEMVSYMIRNTISPGKKEAGIKAGISSKAGDRGSGLVIARNIVEKYDRITLNSYFQEDCFVQNLIVRSPC